MDVDLFFCSVVKEKGSTTYRRVCHFVILMIWAFFSMYALKSILLGGLILPGMGLPLEVLICRHQKKIGLG